MRLIGIYCIRHILSGMCYVGQSVNLKERSRRHYTQPDNSMYIDRAIKKHGKDVFVLEILELCSIDELDDRECHWIATLDSFGTNGYNLTRGGEGWRHTEETKAKISQAHKGREKSAEHIAKIAKANTGKKRSPEQCKKMSEMFSGEKNGFYGKTHTPEVRAKISERNRQRIVSEQTRQRMSEAHTGLKHTPEACEKISIAKQGEKNPFYGKKHSPESLAKMSKALKGRVISDETKEKMSEARRQWWRKRKYNPEQMTLF